MQNMSSVTFNVNKNGAYTYSIHFYSHFIISIPISSPKASPIWKDGRPVSNEVMLQLIELRWSVSNLSSLVCIILASTRLPTNKNKKCSFKVI